jgi:hypothetical protein
MREELAPPYASAEFAPVAGRTTLRKQGQRSKVPRRYRRSKKGAGLSLGAIEFQREETV